MFDRITFDPQIMGGKACIRGMRIPVSVIVGQIAHGATFEEILEDYPDLETWTKSPFFRDCFWSPALCPRDSLARPTTPWRGAAPRASPEAS